MTYLVDTNILINALNGRQGHSELLYDLVGQGYRLTCCTVTLGELFAGIKPPDLVKVEEFVSLFAWYASSPAIARRAGRFRFEYARKGIVLSFARYAHRGDRARTWPHA